jgi:hypothetical protein
MHRAIQSWHEKLGVGPPGRVLTTDAVERLARQLVPRYSQRPAGGVVRRKLQALERIISRFSSEWLGIVLGGILVIAVAIDSIVNRKRGS